MVIIIGSKKVFDKNPTFFMLKARKRLGIEGTYFNIMEAIYNNPTVNELKAFELKSGTRQMFTFSSFFFSILTQYSVCSAS